MRMLEYNIQCRQREKAELHVGDNNKLKWKVEVIISGIDQRRRKGRRVCVNIPDTWRQVAF